jgi:cysteine desulfurase/selenocysteine lyase
VTLLAQLAGEFFAALPSGSHDARLPFAATAPAAADRAGPGQPRAGPRPRAGPPGRGPRRSRRCRHRHRPRRQPGVGVPEAYAAALPRVESPEPPRGPSAVLALLLPGRSQRLSLRRALNALSAPVPPGQRRACAGRPGHRPLLRPARRHRAARPACGARRRQAGARPGGTRRTGLLLPRPQRRRAGPRRHPSPRPAFDVQAVRRDFPSCRSGSMAGR